MFDAGLVGARALPPRPTRSPDEDGPLSYVSAHQAVGHIMCFGTVRDEISVTSHMASDGAILRNFARFLRQLYIKLKHCAQNLHIAHSTSRASRGGRCAPLGLGCLCGHVAGAVEARR